MASRILMVITLLTLLVPLLFIKACKSLASTIYHSMDCDRFNIDHIELRTGIDVPKITRNRCELNDSSRLVSFQLLKSGADKAAYAAKYFTWKEGSYFSAAGENHDTYWSASLDTATGELIFNIHYR